MHSDYSIIWRVFLWFWMFFLSKLKMHFIQFMIIILFLTPLSLSAVTYYIATDGNDANDGLSLATAFQTIQHASAVVQTGDQVFVRGGTYQGPVDITTSGTSSDPIVFSAYLDEIPVIVESETDSNWMTYTGDIYQATINPLIRHVVIDGQILNQALSLHTLAEGEFLQVGGILYVWCPGGGSPANRDTGIIRSEATADRGIVTISGSYVEFIGFVLSYAPERGISTWEADNVIIRNCNVSYASFHGIYIGKGFNCEVVNCKVHHTVLQNWPRGSAQFHDAGIVYYSGGNGLIEGNLVYLNHGEGIGTKGGFGEPGVAGLRIGRNTVYDNWSVNIWIDHGTDVTVDRNFAFVSGSQPFPELPKSTPAGILCAEEIGFGQPGDLKNGTVTNNIVTGCREGFGFWNDRLGSGLNNFLVAHNTFIDNVNGAVIIEDGIHTSTFLNNIFHQTDNFLINIINPDGVLFDYNSWYHHSYDTVFGWGGFNYSYDQWCQSTGQGLNSQWALPQFVSGDPLFSDSYKLQADSPCRDRGVTLPQVSEDFYGNPRPEGSRSDIGAYEFYSTLFGDSDSDGDVDGLDLSDYILNTAGISLNDFAVSFGRVEWNIN